MLNHLFSFLFLLSWVVCIATTPQPAPTPRPANHVAPHQIERTDLTNVQFYIEELNCLALNAYFEARNSVWEDMIAASHVVVNRVNQGRFPETICDVIRQPYQFSWMNDGKNHTPNLTHPLEAAAWRASVLAAIATYLNIVKDPTGGATHYHAYYVEPYWTDPKRIKIGKHYYMKVA